MSAAIAIDLNQERAALAKARDRLAARAESVLDSAGIHAGAHIRVWRRDQPRESGDTYILDLVDTAAMALVLLPTTRTGDRHKTRGAFFLGFEDISRYLFEVIEPMANGQQLEAAPERSAP